MSVKVKNLSKVFGVQRAVNDISFAVEKGEIVGFLGPNGAGKSTTMKIATCYIQPTLGTIEVCGKDVINESREVRKRIGYLPENNPLYLDMYVHEYLKFIGSLHSLSGKNLRDRVGEMIAICGLTKEQNKKIGTLSKGYRQRVGLAQAIIHDPEVFILDEPTTGLDPNQIVEIRNLIKSISEEKTVIFSTHIMQEVQALCDRVIIINTGKIIADSSVDSLQVEEESFNVLTAEFADEVSLQTLEEIEGVLEVLSVGEGKYVLKADKGKDIRSEVFRFASKNNKTLIGLKLEEESLEEIFQKLTKE